MNRQPARRATSAPKHPARQLPLPAQTTGEQIRTTHTPELVIALCGPIGSPLHDVANTLKRLLTEDYSYECYIILASTFISDRFPVPEGASANARAHHLIDRGNELRKTFGNGVLVVLAVREISLRRQRLHDDKSQGSRTKKVAQKRFQPVRICHVIDSIKNGSELDTLRQVYGSLLHTVGVFASEGNRKAQLGGSIPIPEDVQKLIERDAQEGIPHGQSVRSTFPLSDYFVRGDGGKDKTEAKLKRLLELIFGIGVNTPTPSETAMYHAASAAKGSACLSRQVGAAIADKDGQLIAVGWNEVPKYKGGVYTSADDPDCRCCNYKGKCCSNDAQKQRIAREVAEALRNHGLIEQADVSEATDVVRRSSVGGLVEFSRAVHAEMHAIILGSQIGGERMKGASLYCTTYPCHSCARHIVLAGISTVCYIEPYPKSQAIVLHDDAISETEDAGGRVCFLPYEGVGPNRYLEMFGIGSCKRKSDGDGKLVRQQRSSALPKDLRSLESFPTLEGLVVAHLHKTGVLGQNGATHDEPA